MTQTTKQRSSWADVVVKTVRDTFLAAAIGGLGGVATYGIAMNVSPDYQERYPSLSVTDAEALKMDNVEKYSWLVGGYLFIGAMSGLSMAGRKQEGPKP
ncbi:MAG: hypothetical protein H6867_07305 [Rhodospirillales bacterium]|nr:hypothetical protein [Rhodospirillales bacterium]MCB9995358.1 hypothetical protein [Rhodospirillales bacterium]